MDSPRCCSCGRPTGLLNLYCYDCEAKEEKRKLRLRISELEQENERLWKLLEVINEECELGVCKASEIARQAIEKRE